MTFRLRTDAGTKDELLQNAYGPWPQSVGDSQDFDIIGDESFCSKNQMLGEEKDDAEDICLMYPILQTLSMPECLKESESLKVVKAKSATLEAWSRNESLVRLSLHGDHPLSRFINSSWGMFVDVPVRELVDSTGDLVGKSTHHDIFIRIKYAFACHFYLR